MATISDVKSTLHKYVVETEDMDILNHVKEYFGSLLKAKEEVIGYTPEGKPLSVQDYKKDIDDARAEVKAGKTISQAALEKGSENW